MKNLNDIYKSIIERFKKSSKLDIAEGSVIDTYTNSVAAGISDVYEEIENNKNPHIFTNLKGKDIDSMGMLVGCPRRPEEDDKSYLYRMINWNTSNQASNSTAIETALMELSFSSNATHVPFTQGVGTATVYIIPKKISEAENAIKEVKERLSKVVSKSSYIEYVIPKILPVKLIIFASIPKDINNVKDNITKKIEDYINGIAPGDYLEIGKINKLGINEQNVDYFSVSQMYISNDEVQDFKVVQKLEEKFLFDEIIWNMVVM